MNESEYKEIGERLAIEAVKAGVGADHLRRLYQRTKTKPIPVIEVTVKNLTARAEKQRRGGPRGFDQFGPKLLKVVEKFKDDKPGLQKVLWYANMLFDYEKTSAERSSTLRRSGEREPRGRPSGGDRPRAPDSPRAIDLRNRLEPLVSRFCSRYGFSGMRLREERAGWLCNVRLDRFRGNPIPLSEGLYREAISQFPELRGSIRFWIEMNGRR